MKKKGVYPYDYMDSFTKFNDTQLPQKDDFYSITHRERPLLGNIIVHTNIKTFWEQKVTPGPVRGGVAVALWPDGVGQLVPLRRGRCPRSSTPFLGPAFHTSQQKATRLPQRLARPPGNFLFSTIFDGGVYYDVSHRSGLSPLCVADILDMSAPIATQKRPNCAPTATQKRPNSDPTATQLHPTATQKLHNSGPIVVYTASNKYLFFFRRSLFHMISTLSTTVFRFNVGRESRNHMKHASPERNSRKEKRLTNRHKGVRYDARPFVFVAVPPFFFRRRPSSTRSHGSWCYTFWRKSFNEVEPSTSDRFNHDAQSDLDVVQVQYVVPSFGDPYPDRFNPFWCRRGGTQDGEGTLWKGNWREDQPSTSCRERQSAHLGRPAKPSHSG